MAHRPPIRRESRARGRRGAPETAHRFQLSNGREDVRDRLALRRAGGLGPPGRRASRQLRDDGRDPARRARGHVRDDEDGGSEPNHGRLGQRDPERARRLGEDVLRRDGGEADRRLRQGGGGSAREGERAAGRELSGFPPRPMWNALADPLADWLVQHDASAPELPEERHSDPDERADEDVGGPVESEVDAAQTDEGRERHRGAPGPPAESQTDEACKGERAGCVTAGERWIGLRGAPVSGEGPRPERNVDTWPRPVDEVLDRRREDDREDEDENEIERRLALATQPERDREESEDVRAAERRDEDHDDVQGRVRAGEVERPEEELVHTSD